MPQNASPLSLLTASAQDWPWRGGGGQDNARTHGMSSDGNSAVNLNSVWSSSGNQCYEAETHHELARSSSARNLAAPANLKSWPCEKNSTVADIAYACKVQYFFLIFDITYAPDGHH